MNARLATLLCLASPALAFATPPPMLVADADHSSLRFFFKQAGATNQGVFQHMTARLQFDAKNLAGSTLLVEVQVNSINTQDTDRDSILKGADLFDAARHPTAKFVARSISRATDGSYLADGKLTLRGLTRNVRLPMTIQITATAGVLRAELKGATTIRRLDYGIGQGEWQSTEWVGNDVRIEYALALKTQTR